MAQQDQNILNMIANPMAGLSQVSNALYQYGVDKDRNKQQNRLNTIQDKQLVEESKARKLEMMQKIAPAMVGLFTSAGQLPLEQRAGYLQQNKQLFDYAGIDLAQMDATDTTDEGLKKLSGVFAPLANLQADSKVFQPVVVSDASGKTGLVMPTSKNGVAGSQMVPMPEGFSAAVETPQQKRTREAQAKMHEKLEGERGKNAAEFENLADSWDVNKSFIIDSIPEMKSLMDQAPGSSLSTVIQGFLGKVVGNTKASDAQALLEQYAPIFMQGLPFDPGSQSNAEQEQRLRIVSSTIQNPNVTPTAKIKAIATFIKWQESKAEGQRKKVKQLTGSESVSAPPKSPPAPKQTVGKLPDGVTEDDIQETMRVNKMTRDQVLQRLGVK